MEVILNPKQREAVSWYFNPENHDGEEWPLNEPVQIEVDRGELVLGGAYLHEDGEWATFHSQDIREDDPETKYYNESTGGYKGRGQGTRDDESMRAYAKRASLSELRAVLAEAPREGDFALARILRAEVERREVR